ncbi:type II toxin-antitoxin system RelE/ParE family toxin [Halopseudomonas bauzanensis]|uniref:type II toxin-antitoxin system RelE/ParE family toxin n=1 Tax=Halopseudomonas bauzanensis TaxID=653930 RepID=UPI003523F346
MPKSLWNPRGGSYRRLQVEHHAVFYKVIEPEVLVIRVLHEDMDAPQRLLD